MYIKFKTEADYQNYTLEAEIPSGTIAYITDNKQVYFTTNNIDGELKTYQLSEGGGELPEEVKEMLDQILEELGKEQERIDTLVSGDTTEAIDNFKEIEAFLSGFTDSETEGLKQQLDSKANAADVYNKTEVDMLISPFVTKNELDNKANVDDIPTDYVHTSETIELVAELEDGSTKTYTLYGVEQ